MAVREFKGAPCQCGCGNRASFSRGRQRRFLSGHSDRVLPPAYVVEDRGYKTPCWVWQRGLTDGGYGKLQDGERTRQAHVVYYERKFGPVPEDLQLDHLCRVRPCVNSDHVEPVTPAENSRRGARTKLSKEAVLLIKQALTWGWSCKTLGKAFGVHETTVRDIKQGRSWRGES